MEAGWIVTEVGRQPWIVYGIMKVEDAVTGNTGVWISFCAVVVLYLAVGITTILVLRGMSRRFRRAGGFTDHDAPYAPSAPPEETSPTPRGGGPVITAVAVVLLAAVVAYAVFGGADFGAGFWDLTAGGPERGARPRAVIEHSIGPVWEANHVWLIFIFVILWTSFPEAYASITLTLFVPLMIAALGIVLRGASFAFRKAVVTTRNRRLFGAGVRRLLGAGPVLHGSDRGRDRLGTSAGRRPGGGSGGQLDQPDLRRRWGPGRRRGRLPVRGLSRVGRPTPGPDGHGRVLPPPSSRLPPSSWP